MNGDTTMTSALPTSGGGLRKPGGALRMRPARILTLVIGVPLALILIGWTSFGVVAELAVASFPVSYAIPVHDGQLVANVASGNVTVRPGGGDTAHLVGVVQYNLIRPGITENAAASRTTVDVTCHVVIGSCGLNATLTVPARTDVSLSTDGGDMAVSGVAGNVKLSSAGGNVTVSGVGGNASVSTGGGNITASGLPGQLTFTTSGGNINGDTLSALHVNTDSGGGDVSLVFTQPPANLDMVSHGGNIKVVLPHSSTGYAITNSSGGGNVSEPVTLNSTSPDKITVDSGGGNISITEAG